MDREILRKAKIEECNFKISQLHKKFPRLQEIEEEISKLCLERINVEIFRRNSNKAKKIDEEVKLLIKEKELILQANSIPLNIYEPEWNCPKCQDRGYIEPGKLCECFIQERLDKVFNKSGIAGDLKNKTFTTFEVSFYKDPAGMQKKVNRCKIFVEKLLKNESQNNLFFRGDVGRGKTHLSLAIANAALQKGATVIFKRADELLDMIREFKFQKDADYYEGVENINFLKEVDLLIIDDLGSEISTFSENQLRFLIEDRNNFNRPWIINSNLSISDLQKVCTQRLTDRIIEKADIFVFETDKSIREIIRAKEIQREKN